MFFSLSPDVLSRSHPRGNPALTLPMLTALEKHEISPLTIFRSGSHDAYVHASSHASPPLQFVPLLRGLPSAASAPHFPPRRACPHRRTPNGLQLSLRRHTKKRDTHHGGECRVEAEGDACRHATASPHRQFSTERACCSNRARSQSCAHRASACCRERVRGTCGDRTHRASQRRPYG